MMGTHRHGGFWKRWRTTFVAFLFQRVKGRGGIPVSKPVFHSRNEPLEEQYAAVEADGVSEHDRAE